MKKLFLLQGYKYLYDEFNKELVILDLLDNKSTTYYGVTATEINEMFTTDWDYVKNKALAEDFIKQGIAYIFEDNIYIEEWKVSSDLNVPGLLEKIPFVQKAFIDFGDYTNEERWIGNDKIYLRPCLNIGNRKRQIADGLIEKLTEFFSNLYIKDLYIKGIDGKKGSEYLSKFIESFATKNDDVKIHMVVGEIRENHISLAKKKRAKIVLSIAAENLLGDKNLKYAKDNNMNISISLFGDKCEILQAQENIAHEDITIENISECVTGDMLATVLTFNQRKNINTIRFPETIEGHLCLNGSIFIDADGGIYPCPAKSECIGNILTEKPEKIFSEDGLYKWWKLSKHKCEACSECIYRYGCEDCIVAETLNSELKTRFICENMKA